MGELFQEVFWLVKAINRAEMQTNFKVRKRAIDLIEKVKIYQEMKSKNLKQQKKGQGQ